MKFEIRNRTPNMVQVERKNDDTIFLNAGDVVAVDGMPDNHQRLRKLGIAIKPARPDAKEVPVFVPTPKPEPVSEETKEPVAGATERPAKKKKSVRRGSGRREERSDSTESENESGGEASS